jgi:hypothetical protein
MLVAWGQYAHCLVLIAGIEAAPLQQKTVTHRPQTKVIEFLVTILGGLPHLQDISRSAHPLGQDQEVPEPELSQLGLMMAVQSYPIRANDGQGTAAKTTKL